MSENRDNPPAIQPLQIATLEATAKLIRDVAQVFDDAANGAARAAGEHVAVIGGKVFSDEQIAAALTLLESSRELSAALAYFVNTMADTLQLSRCRARVAVQSVEELSLRTDGVRSFKIITRDRWSDDDVSELLLAVIPIPHKTRITIANQSECGREFVVTVDAEGD